MFDWVLNTSINYQTLLKTNKDILESKRDKATKQQCNNDIATMQ